MLIAPDEDEDHALLLLREIVSSCIQILSKSQVTRIVFIPKLPYACTCWYSSVICLSTLNEWLRSDNFYNVVAPLCHIHHLQVQSVPTKKRVWMGLWMWCSSGISCSSFLGHIVWQFTWGIARSSWNSQPHLLDIFRVLRFLSQLKYLELRIEL